MPIWPKWHHKTTRIWCLGVVCVLYVVLLCFYLYHSDEPSYLIRTIKSACGNLLRASKTWFIKAHIVQDWSFQCPSNAIRTFKIYLSQNNPSKCNPKVKMKASLEVITIICMSQEPISVGHLSLQEVELDGWFLIPHIILETCIT